MKKFIANVLIIIYVICAIFITVCLLSFNEYRVTEFGSYSMIIVDSNDIKGDFSKGSLLIIDKDEEPVVGDKTFFYNTDNKNEIALAEVKEKEEITETETTYTFDGDKLVSDKYIIGSATHAKEYKNLGTVLSIVESKWGYLFLVVLPSLLAFIYEISKAISEIKESKKEEKEEKKEKVSKD